jgi:hypothetical protein
MTQQVQDPERWFVTNGEWRMGPLTIEDVVEVLGRGHPAGSVYIWAPGLSDWVQAELVPDVAAARAGLPVPRPMAAAPVAAPRPAPPATPWFVVGSSKFLLMCVVTFGLYQLYWFYQQWRHVQRRGESVHPALRTLLSGLFCYALFRRIADTALERRVDPVPSPLLCTAAFIGLSLTVRLPQPWSLLSLLSLLPLALVQRTASKVALADVPTADPNTRLTPLNWIGIAMAAVLLILTLIGAAVGPPPPADAPKPRPAPAATTQVKAI